MSTKKSFTLIELLVVVAIIAVLVAVLLPALNHAREMAQRLSCLSNVHTIASAMMMYTMDNNDTYPPTSYGPDNDAGCWKAWCTYGTWDPDYEKAVGHGILMRNKYVENILVYACPSQPKSSYPAICVYRYRDDSSYARTDGEGNVWPKAVSYNLRGWLDTQAQWCKPEDTSYRAITADAFWTASLLTYHNGLNVGYSDGSAKFVSADSKMPEYDMTFIDAMIAWGHPISSQNHHAAYECFDRF